MKNIGFLNKQTNDTSLIESELSVNDDDIDDTITVRVLTKEGIKKWELSKV